MYTAVADGETVIEVDADAVDHKYCRAPLAARLTAFPAQIVGDAGTIEVSGNGKTVTVTASLAPDIVQFGDAR